MYNNTNIMPTCANGTCNLASNIREQRFINQEPEFLYTPTTFTNNDMTNNSDRIHHFGGFGGGFGGGWGFRPWGRPWGFGGFGVPFLLGTVTGAALTPNTFGYPNQFYYPY